MKVFKSQIKTFKIRNRRGYTALCLRHLTEGLTGSLAIDRMIKALRRSKIEVK